MSGSVTRHAATNDALLAHALAPAMRWLIATALDDGTMTYGQVKRRLEAEEGFSTIFATRIGLVAGELMNRIPAVDQDAPLINVLVVNQTDGLPSKGASSFMATKFKNHRLNARNYKELTRPNGGRTSNGRPPRSTPTRRRPEPTSTRVPSAPPLAQKTIETERDKRQSGNEDDFGTGSGKYGAGGEGEHHKALRLWVTDNPGKVGRRFARARTETEFNLDSGDRIDPVYQLPDRTIVLEVKSRISNEVDLRRGVFRCIKYRAVKTAMDVRMEVPVEAFLVTETELSGEIAALLRQHDIRHFQAPIKRTR